MKRMHVSGRKVLPLLVATIFVSSCGVLSDDSYEVSVRTDRESYAAVPGEKITLRVTNESSSPVYFVCHGLVDLQQIEGGRVIESWYVSGAEQCGIVALGEDESTQREYVFDEELRLGFISGITYDPNLLFRLRFQLFRERDGRTNPIDENLQYSNSFSIVKPTAN